MSDPKSSNPAVLLDDLPRGVTHRSLDEHSLPVAAWANPADIIRSEKLRHAPGKVLLGAIEGHTIGTDDNRHILWCAGNRGGKGVSHLMPNHLHGVQGSSLTIDPKGEICSTVAPYLAETLGQKVYILDPFERSAPWVHKYWASFNPLSVLRDPRYQVENSGLIADGLVSNRSQTDPHWDDSGIQLLEGVLLHIATFPAYEGQRDLLTVRRLLTRGVPNPHDPAMRGIEGLLCEMITNGAAGGLVQSVAMSLAHKFDKELDSIFSTAVRHTKFLDYPAMKTVLQKHDFDLSELKTSTKGVAIFLCLPAGRIATCKGWIRLFINLALEAMENTRLRQGGPLDETGTGRPVCFYLDEFPVLGKMAQIESAAPYVAGFAVKLFFVVQDLSQVKAAYGDAWQTFLGNCGVLVFFANNDSFTLEFIAKRLGQTSVIVRQRNQQTHGAKMDGATGENFNTQVQDLLTPEEAGRYFARDDRQRRQLVLLAGKDPMILQRVVYHDASLPEHRHFAGKFRRWS